MAELLAPGLSGWWLLVIAGALLIVTELGFRLGHRQRAFLEEKKAQSNVHVAALLGLLGLLLGFSFSIVETRFGERRSLVVQEANAIGTTYLRAQTLPAPHDERVKALLRQYVDLRVGPKTPEELERKIQESVALHGALWNEARAVAAEQPQSQPVALFERSLNEMIDLHATRKDVILHQRLPPAILVMLYAVAGLSTGLLGFGAGLARTRSLVPTAGLIIAITVVVVLIVDLDKPASSMFNVSQSSFATLQQQMSK